MTKLILHDDSGRERHQSDPLTEISDLLAFVDALERGRSYTPRQLLMLTDDQWDGDGEWEDVDDDAHDEPVGPVESQGVGIARAHEAITQLKRIPKADALRGRAMEIVSDWIDFNASEAEPDESPLTGLRPRIFALTDEQLIVVREWISERLGGGR